jgi:glycosyltransferase involved in cell wall biosynthesis
MMIKVLNILLDERISGPSKRILIIARELKKNGIETIVVLPKGETTFSEDLLKAGIKSYILPLKRIRNTKNPIPNLIWVFSLLKNVIDIERIINQDKIDIIHCNGLVNIVGGLAGRKAGLKVMYHLNDIATPFIIKSIFKAIIQRCSDSIVFASGAVQDHFGRIKDGLQYGILNAPVDTKYFKKSTNSNIRMKIRESLGLKSEEIVVGTVGNINYLKGVPDFVRAAGIIHKQKSEVVFIHVGAKLDTKQGLFSQVLSETKRSHLNDHFIFTGERNDIKEILEAMDIFVLPSIAEACPISLLEAMSMEKPIVATNVGGIPEMIRDKNEGLLVPVNSPEKIADGVLWHMNNHLLSEKMAKNARIRAVELFDIKKCVRAHEKYYRTLKR